MASLGVPAAGGRAAAPPKDPLKDLRVLPVSSASDLSWNMRRWVPVDTPEAFEQGELVNPAPNSEEAKAATEGDVRLPSGTLYKGPFERVNPPETANEENMTALTQLNTPSVLHHVRRRYGNGLIHTYSGLFLIVVNPYKTLSIYGRDVMQCYNSKPREDLPPHVYAIADAAFRGMLEGKNQNILCTGESGAGKTENTKRIVEYLANINACMSGATEKRVTRGGPRRPTTVHVPNHSAVGISGPQSPVDQKLLQANPALEAFGNAMTVRNDNSSRFGKLFQIYFDRNGAVARCTCQTFLLEKARVVHQNAGERNFHIFYQLLAGADDDLKKDLGLLGVPSCAYLSTSAGKHIDDATGFMLTNRALATLGIAPVVEKDARVGTDPRVDMWRILAAILHLGQLDITQDASGQAVFTSNDLALQHVSSLLGVNLTSLSKALLNPQFTAAGETFTVGQTVENVKSAAASIAKTLYHLLFLYIVQAVSQISSQQQAGNYIGVLDIAGFEIFKVNSFEQMCINYVNENLQHAFNQHFFGKEKKEYEAEGIEWVGVGYGVDLQLTIDFFSGEGGAFKLLNDAAQGMGASDSNFVRELYRQAKFTKSRGRVDGRDPGPVLCPADKLAKEPQFVVSHYAGKVTYTVSGWRDKNRDPLNANVAELLKAAGNPLVQHLWSDVFKAHDSTGSVDSAQHSSRFRSLLADITSQMRALSGLLKDSEQHFVRCVLPNSEKKPGVFVPRLVMEQLSCNGVLQGIEVCRSGYPTRMTFAEFMVKFMILMPKPILRGTMTSQEACKIMLKELNAVNYAVGTTKIFFKEGVLHDLKARLVSTLAERVVQLQARCRGYLDRRKGPPGRPPALVVPPPEFLSELERLRAQVALLEKDKKEQAQQLEESEQRCAQLEANLKDALDAKEEVEKERNALKTQVDGLLKRNRIVEDENTMLSGELQELNKDLAELGLERRRLEEQVKASGAENVAVIARLQKQVVDLQKALDAVNLVASADKEDMAELQKRIQGLTEGLDESAKIVSRLKREMNDLRAQLSREEYLVGTTKGENATLTKDNGALNAEVAELKKNLAQALKELDDVKKRAAETEAALQKDLQEKTKTVATLETEVDRLSKVVDGKGDAVRKLNEDIKALTKEKNELAVELKTERELHEETKGALAAALQRIGHTSEKYATLLDKLEKELEVASENIKTLSEEKVDLESNVLMLQSDVRLKDERLEELEAEVADYKDTTDTQIRLIERCHVTIADQQNKLHDLSRVAGELVFVQGTSEKHKMELQLLREQYENVVNQLHSSERKVQILTEDVARVQGQLDRAKAMLTQTVTQLRGVGARIAHDTLGQ